MAPFRAVAAVLLAAASAAAGAAAWEAGEWGAEAGCARTGGEPGYRFLSGCPGRAVSPGGRWSVVQAEGEWPFLADSEARRGDPIPGLADAMPFVLFWSPRSDWFFVNHYRGSAQERLRIFQIVNGEAVERSAAYAEAARVMAELYSCLARGATIGASGLRWSRDGRRIAMAVYARPDACLVEQRKDEWVEEGRWQPLWMIADARTGRIEPASIRARADADKSLPEDGAYADF